MSTTAQARRHRYARSTTTSVTQLLSESCSSLLQRITTRVRGTSTNRDNVATSSSATSAAVLGLGSTRSRLEDKYSSVLDKYARRRGDAGTRREKTESRRGDPVVEKERSKSPPPLSKSATTANVVLAEKAYPYVSCSNAAAPVREKTPYRHGEHRLLQHQQQVYSGHRHRHKSGQTDKTDKNERNDKTDRNDKIDRNDKNDRIRRAPLRPTRVGKSEQGERALLSSHLRLCPVEIDPSSIDEPPKQQELPLEDTINEREARRKEIQCLIMKYTALDEAYNKRVAETKKAAEESNRKSTAQDGKSYLLDDVYNRVYEPKSSKQKSVKSSNISSKYHQKYTSNLVPTVSNVWT